MFHFEFAATSTRASMYAVKYSRNRSARAASRGGMSPTALSFDAKSSPMRATHAAVSLSIESPDDWAAEMDSTFSLISFASFIGTLPSRTAFRSPSLLTNRMRRRPFLSVEMLAMTQNPFAVRRGHGLGGPSLRLRLKVDGIYPGASRRARAVVVVS